MNADDVRVELTVWQRLPEDADPAGYEEVGLRYTSGSGPARGWILKADADRLRAAGVKGWA